VRVRVRSAYRASWSRVAIGKNYANAVPSARRSIKMPSR
jgi:hypothetical protein